MIQTKMDPKIVSLLPVLADRIDAYDLYSGMYAAYYVGSGFGQILTPKRGQSRTATVGEVRIALDRATFQLREFASGHSYFPAAACSLLSGILVLGHGWVISEYPFSGDLRVALQLFRVALIDPSDNPFLYTDYLGELLGV